MVLMITTFIITKVFRDGRGWLLVCISNGDSPSSPPPSVNHQSKLFYCLSLAFVLRLISWCIQWIFQFESKKNNRSSLLVGGGITIWGWGSSKGRGTILCCLGGRWRSGYLHFQTSPSSSPSSPSPPSSSSVVRFLHSKNIKFEFSAQLSLYIGRWFISQYFVSNYLGIYWLVKIQT